MTARIYRPARTAMQSGTAKTERWLLEYEPEQPRQIEPLMGWTSSGDMKSQLKLWFDSEAEAVAYATRNGIAYRVEQPNEPQRRTVAYSDNFKFSRLGQWTH
ncbi:ETC complex I subunit [Bosea sp. (in: a-proteobacteria)]|uniref:ETC complex I subunit n=1 Tax=Bosea sp. (in: a-proteobacteria) TaxID=1871050 RepID=UPI002732A83D|nr:ETC complex I subunit [Bosea sp. (in: a-proteobacteria)]MDP3407281.1 ETC complex I subunit [Bosea sp. (in: a-proteobacteria)]